jgi:hypothetical protein
VQVSATPLAQPWPDQERHMLTMRRWFTHRELPEAPELQAAIVAALAADNDAGGPPADADDAGAGAAGVPWLLWVGAAD